MATPPPLLITGAAGLVGQNLIACLVQAGRSDIVAIDKHPANTRTLARLQPGIRVIEADLAQPGDWAAAFPVGGTLVLAHAQIGGQDGAAFQANNIIATKNVLAAAQAAGIGHIVHISSSVVNSKARDFYTETKRAQEELVAACPIAHVILRPTLMFGWFDRKHLGWLARFMRRAPVFPIPGDGRYRRQPLYAGDFCAVILSCIEDGRAGEAHDISGLEIIDYIDLIREVRNASGAGTPILRIPFRLFRALLRAYSMIDRNPPFTTKQLDALALPELFTVTDWPATFAIKATPLRQALHTTFQTRPYCEVELEF